MAVSLSEFLPLDFGKEEAQKHVLKQLREKRQESSDSLESFPGIYPKISGIKNILTFSM